MEKEEINCMIYLNKRKGKETAEIKILGDKESLYQGLNNLLECFISNNIFDGSELCQITKNVLEHGGDYKVYIKES